MKRLLKILSIILIVLLCSSTLYAGIGAWSRISNATVTKVTTGVGVIADEASLSIVNTGAAQGYAGQSIKTASGEDYYLYGLIKPQITPLASARIIDVDGTASMSQTVGQAKLMGKNVDCNALYFAQAVDNTKHQITNEDICVSAWVKLDTDASAWSTIISKNQGGLIYYVFGFGSSGKGLIMLYDGTNSYDLSGITDLRDNKWHYIAFIIDRDNNNNCKIIVDGNNDSNIGTGIASILSLSNTAIFTLGAYSGGSNGVFDGQICDAKIVIGSVWSAAQILYQYNNPFDISASAGTITESYACTEGTGTTLTALVTPATNNLTLSNALAWNLGETQECEFTFQAADTDTTIDLTVPCAVSGELAYWDNVKMVKNYVVNGGCEGGADPPASWTQEVNATVVSDTTPHAGTNCLKITAGAVNVGAKQSITLVSGQYYTVVGYAKATAGDTVGIYMDTGTGTIATIGTTTATTWTRIRGSFKAVGTAGVIYCRGVANGDIVWVDDVALLRDDSAVANTATKGSGVIPSNQPMLIR